MVNFQVGTKLQEGENIVSFKGDLVLKLKKARIAKEWRKKNSHNFTTVDGIFDLKQVSVGNGTYGTLHIDSYGNRESKLEIGNYCSVAREVRFILDGEHDINSVSLYPFRTRYLDGSVEAMSKGKIVVEDDVWIGERCLILSGVRIGQGAVIGAGSIVAKDVPPYAVFAGGRIVKYRFSDEEINQLLEFDYGKLTCELIEGNADDLYNDLEKF